MDPHFEIVLHHTASKGFRRPIEASDIFVLDDQHRRKNKWSAIGYHALLGPVGQVVFNADRFQRLSRHWSFLEGAHCFRQNSKLGFALHGDFSAATIQQCFQYREALCRAILWACAGACLSKGKAFFTASVAPHFWFGRTACPARAVCLCGVYRFENVQAVDGHWIGQYRYFDQREGSSDFQDHFTEFKVEDLTGDAEEFEIVRANGVNVQFNDGNPDGLCWLT